MSSFDLKYNEYLTIFEQYATSYAEKMQTKPPLLSESMRYSLLNGGKRIRPVLMLACADVLSLPREDVLPFALALEMIHTYSLIHDDLPAMDNDDFRRGKPSCHKAFGEGNAILAGDGLLNEAYAICLRVCLRGENFVRAGQCLNDCAGIYGMIAGQSADLYFTNGKKEVSAEDLTYIHEHKTGKLLIASVVISSILAQNRHYLQFEQFGKLFGFLFQITDDILDVTGDFASLGKTVGKDEAENKLTIISLYGLEKAKLHADICARDCHAVLEGIDGDTQFLKDLVDYVLNRTN